MNSNSYDVIVIGAGLSGLSAAIRTACYQDKVCLIEKHGLLGGLNSYYNKSGFHFDVGLHAMTNFCLKTSSRHKALLRALRQLKINYDDLNLIPQKISKTSNPLISLEFNNNTDFFVEQIEKISPQDKSGVLNLINYIKKNLDSPIKNTPFVSTREKLKEFIKCPQLTEILLCPILFYGSATQNDIDFPQFCIIFTSIFLEGFCRPINGMRSVIKVLKNRYHELGGTLKVNLGVKKILHKNGKAYGIITEKNEEILGKKIISSIGLIESLQLANLKTEKVKKGKLSFIESIFLFSKNPKDFGIKYSIEFINKNKKFFSYQDPKNSLVDLQSAVLCCPQNFDFPKTHKHKFYTLRLTHLTQQDKWFQFSTEEYKKQKEIFIKQQLQKFIPHELKKSLIFTDAFTPKTVKHYTGHHQGVIYGSETKQKDGKTPIKNLFICGTDQGLLGIVGSLLSGIIIANNYVLKS